MLGNTLELDKSVHWETKNESNRLAFFFEVPNNSPNSLNNLSIWYFQTLRVNGGGGEKSWDSSY